MKSTAAATEATAIGLQLTSRRTATATASGASTAVARTPRKPTVPSGAGARLTPARGRVDRRLRRRRARDDRDAALTTVRQPLAEMGRTAVSLLNRLLERQRFETLHVELATRLVVRDSTAPPRAGA